MSEVHATRGDPPSALPLGTRLGEFELTKVLGAGGFEIVYLAFDHALGLETAVKEYMPRSLARRDESVQVSLRSPSDADAYSLGLKTFINEARLLARFDHPSLLKVYRLWEANGTAYVAMPVMRGRTTKEIRLEMAGPPDEAWLRSLLDPLLSAIETLHHHGVYHRDIAPDNILIEPDGRPVLLDFHAARRVLDDRSGTLTAILRPAYAPIEQYAEAGAVNQGPWTDIYALGATLHFLLLGRPPAPATMRVLTDASTELAGAALPGCSRAFLDTLEWMLASRPSHRPQTVASLREVLEGRLAAPRVPDGLQRPAAQSGRTVEPTAAPLPSLDSEPPSTWTEAPIEPPNVPSAEDPGRVIAPAARPNFNLFPHREQMRKRAASLNSVRHMLAPTRLVSAAFQVLRDRLSRRSATTADAASRSKVEEPLLFGVTAPRKTLPGSEFAVSFAAYVESAKAEAVKHARSLVGSGARQILDIAPDGGTTWRKGTPFTVRLSGRYFAMEQPEQAFLWSGTKNVLGFAVLLLPSARGSAVLTATVLVHDVVVASIPVQIGILEAGAVQPVEGLAEEVKPAPCSAFASYASKDVENVAGRLSSLTRHAPGLKIFQDCLDLSPGEAYKPQLQAEIASRDVFWLFWSRNAAASMWVRWELDTALSRKPIDAIVPMPLEDPALAPPPEQLAHEHFRDRFMIAGQALARIAEQAELAKKPGAST